VCRTGRNRSFGVRSSLFGFLKIKRLVVVQLPPNLAKDWTRLDFQTLESAPLRLSEEVGCAQKIDQMKVNLNKFKHIWPRSLYNMTQLLSWGGSTPRTGVRRLPQV
jgi:hypothetical protein